MFHFTESKKEKESQIVLFSHGDVVWLLFCHNNRSKSVVQRDGPFEVLLKSTRNGKYHIKELRQPKHRLNYRLRDYNNTPVERLQLCSTDELKLLQLQEEYQN